MGWICAFKALIFALGIHIGPRYSHPLCVSLGRRVSHFHVAVPQCVFIFIIRVPGKARARTLKRHIVSSCRINSTQLCN